MTRALIPVPAEVARARLAQLAASRHAEQEALHDESDPWLRADTEMEIWLGSPDFLKGTRDQYRRVYMSWRTWCLLSGVSPFEALRSDVERYALALAEVGNPAAEHPRPLALRSLNRHLSALSSYYRRAVEDGCVEVNPVPQKRRRLTRDSRQPGLKPEQLRDLIAAADAHSPRAAVLVSLMVLACLRVTEALTARIEDMSYDDGAHYLRVTRKGAKEQTVFLPPQVYRRVAAVTAGRREGPILLTTGSQPLDRKAAWVLIRSLGRQAGIAVPIGPHTLRHAYITRGHQLKVPIERLQDAAGHANVDTTRGYDRSKLSPKDHPSTRIADDLDPDKDDPGATDAAG